MKKVTIQPVDTFFAGSGVIEPFREYSPSAFSIVSSGWWPRSFSVLFTVINTYCVEDPRSL